MLCLLSLQLFLQLLSLLRRRKVYFLGGFLLPCQVIVFLLRLPLGGLKLFAETLCL